ncbi:hypothetical protein BLNAU_24427 [Blattamonas nauphoetae]|uniref:Uncharacterized protein n=1 Tax=Blattamonas nauphoetae TaxID=2049346 RepID=A0ABQ9WPI7_9EUKA|nr:hypothetical protein BLNAU_24427 [Blattamonas nauphoetae]
MGWTERGIQKRGRKQGLHKLSKLKARGYLLLSRIGYAKGNLEDAYFNVLISLQEMEMKENVLWNEELSQQIEVGGEEAVEEEIPDQPEKQKRGDTNTEGGKRQKREKKK